MKKLKVMTIVGTRPELIKLSSCIKKFDKFFEHTLVHTGQNYDFNLNEIFFDDLQIRMPDLFLDVVGKTLGDTMGAVISKSYNVLSEYQPDALVVLGDTNSCLSVISAKRLKIPIFHLEAGNRCKDENLPEEIIRRIVDVTSDVNLCYSEHARRYILDSGARPEFSHVIGSPMAEIIYNSQPQIEKSLIMTKLGLQKSRFMVLSVHREENIDNESVFVNLMSAINSVSEAFDMPIIYSCHPRSRKQIARMKFIFHKNIRVINPLNFSDYVTLQSNSYCVLSDSGTLPEESTCLNFPAVSLRTSTERPEAIENGVFTIGSLTFHSIYNAISVAVGIRKDIIEKLNVESYKDFNFSAKVVSLVQSYTEIINKTIWRKEIM